MFTRTKTRSATTRILEKRSRRSGKLVRTRVDKFDRMRTDGSRDLHSSRTRKPKSRFSDCSPTGSNETLGQPVSGPTLPKDTAVHFGAFYGVRGADTAEVPRKLVDGIRDTGPPLKPTPRLEFTRQMVRNLERTVGTEEYERQVSALLEEAIEPADFKLSSLPAETSVPVHPSGYPRWYKDPCKMPSGENCDGAAWTPREILRDVPDEEDSSGDAYETSSADEEQDDEESASNQSDSTEGCESLINALSCRSTSAVETN